MSTHESVCQHCDYPVTFGQTEHGYRGFVHVATATTACPVSAPTVEEVADLTAWLRSLSRRIVRGEDIDDGEQAAYEARMGELVARLDGLDVGGSGR